jgi:hypothetical protein
MANGVLAAGPPPLTQIAADCAIDLIDFMAAVVRGVDAIDVTPTAREMWRAHLATYYPMLAPVDRFWFANAPANLSAIQANWQLLPQFQRDLYRQAWAMALPQLLQLVDPVLQAAGATPPAVLETAASEVLNKRFAEQQERQQAAAKVSEQALAQQQLDNHMANARQFQRFSNTMTDLTINLMRAMSGRR